MAGWTILETLAGYRYDAVSDSIVFEPAVASDAWNGPFVAGTGWGVAAIGPDGSGELSVKFGEVTARKLGLPVAAGGVRVSLNGQAVEAITNSGPIIFAAPLVMGVGDRLVVANLHE